MSPSAAVLLAASALALAACGEESPPAKAPAPTPDAPARPPAPAPANPAPGTRTRFDPASATATLVVRARAKGTLPRMRPVKFDADPKCGEINRQEVLEETVVARDGLLSNVIAYAKSGPERWTYPAAVGEVVLDQQGCRYLPHVFTIRTAQALVIRNSDPLSHNTHAVPAANLEFNRTQLKGAKDITEKFAREEVGIRVKCDVHGWMGAWAGVFAHPFHGVTGADGTVTLRLPPGTWEFAAWHEYGKFTQPVPVSVVLAAGETKEIEFVFEAK